MHPLVHLVLACSSICALQRVSSNLVAGYIYLHHSSRPRFPPGLDGEHLTRRAVAAGLLIFAGLGLVILAELRQHREIPLEPVGE